MKKYMQGSESSAPYASEMHNANASTVALSKIAFVSSSH